MIQSHWFKKFSLISRWLGLGLRIKVKKIRKKVRVKNSMINIDRNIYINKKNIIHISIICLNFDVNIKKKFFI